MNKKMVIALALVIGLFTISFASAGVLDWVNKITGRATTDTTALNLTIGNTAPTITVVSVVAATDPLEDTLRTIVINFTANDADGAGDLDTAQMFVNSSTEPIRSNSSCNTIDSADGNDQNYSCTIQLYYFDANAVWTINASINDSGNAIAKNDTTTFTFNLLTAMKMSPTALTWGSLTISSTNLGSDVDPVTLNNTGNDVITNISVTAIDLGGEVTTTEYIYAGNFSVNTLDAADNTTMVNNTAIQVSSANFTRSNHSVNDGIAGQEELYFYLESLNSDLSSQSYSSVGGGEWTVAIIT